MMNKKVDIIVSCFNEEDNISPFYNEIIKYLKDDNYYYNIVFVNDGSTDNTYDKIIEVANHNADISKNVNVSYISFIHNFGHEAAMCAGLDKSNADYLIFMDTDLQHPPQKIPDILKCFLDGADCVLPKRTKYKNVTMIKKMFSKGYYLFSKYILRNKNIPDVTDYFAIDRNVANTVKEKYNSRLRFLRSFVQKEANNKVIIEYENADRHSGVSRYNYLKLVRLAIISELSRSKFLRDIYKATKENLIYVIDEKRSYYE
ncbi:MAG: glycosyltransferase family 2 protein [Lachnospiraceae bacterium]|nr:glycosyltransferase family 2 protein [Lachnospiraceae bacterium]